MNVALTDLTTNLPKSKNINHFTANVSNTKLESFDQKLQDIFSGINNKGPRFKNAPMPEKEVINNKLSVTLNTNDSKDLIISNTKKSKNIHLNVDQLLLLIEASTKNAKNINDKELLIQAQKILSSSKTEFTEAELEVLQKALSIITKENKVTQGSNSEIPLESLIKPSKPIEETSPTLSQNNLHSKATQETNQIVNSDIQKLLSTMEESSKSIENKDEINTLEQAQKILISSKAELTEEDKEVLLIQAQKILSSSKIEFTQEDKEVLQKAFNIIIKESKDNRPSNTEISLESLIKPFKPIEEISPTLSQNNLHSKVSQETNQIVQADIQKLLQLIEESSKSIETKNEINTLEQAQKILISSKAELTKEDKEVLLIQAQKILSSSKTEFTKEDKEVLQKALSIITKENKVTQGSNSEDSKAINSQTSLDGLIKHSKPTEENPNIMSQNNLHSKATQEANQIVNSDIQKLLQLIEKSSKSAENNDEINILEEAQKILISSKAELTKEDKRELLIQAQKILSSSKIEFTENDIEVLQKALSIIIKESKDSQGSNSEVSSEGLIKHSKSTEESPNIMLQNNLHLKDSQETNQMVDPDIQKLLSTIEKSSKNIENKNEFNKSANDIDGKELLIQAEETVYSSKTLLTEEDKKEFLNQAQKILSSSKTEFTGDEIEILERVADLIIKENKESNNKISSEGLIKHSKPSEESPNIMLQNSLHSKATQETNQIVNFDIQKLLQLIEESSKSIENKNEINTLEQAQKILISSKAKLTEEDKRELLIQAQEILSSSKTEFTQEDKEVLQKALSIIIKESKDSQGSNSQISLEDLIKYSKPSEETSPTLSQNNLHSKATQEANQIVNSDIQKLLQLIEESSKSMENKNEINTLEQAQKILSSFKTEFTPDELNIIKTALGIINTNNSKMGNSLSSIIEETNLITNSLIKGNTGKTKNNKNENNDSIKSAYFDQKAEILNTKNNLGKNVYFDPYETRKNNVSKDKTSELQKVNAVKLTPTSNLGDISKNLNIEQLKTNPSTNEIDLKSLQINKNNIQDGIPATNLKDLNAQIKEVIISKNTQTFLNESFSVKISPPDLGKVDIQILKNGQAVTVNISTETENAKNIISKTLQSLVGNLRDEGYQPISIKVNVTQEEHYLADQNQQNQQEQEQKKYSEEDQNGDQPEEGTYYTFDEYLRSDLNA